MKEVIFPNTIKEPVALSLGFFDCVHLGHRKLIECTKETAKRLQCKTGIITFSNNPYKLFNPESKLIYTYPERFEKFDELGIDYCVPFKFDQFFKEIPHAEFLNDLFSHINVKALICGYDYLFGAGGTGDTAYLEKECAKRNVELKIIEPVLFNSERVSSTLVKECIESGNILKANDLLCTPYSIRGEVVKGRGVGHLFDVPTVNLNINKDKMLPKLGVYSTITYINGERKKSVTNVGAKPTFDVPQISVETYIDNEDRDLYGENLKIEFLGFIREIAKFDSPCELSVQIKADLKR